ncbi:MAG: hypothetical protein SGI86_06440 [Deltaproteobacteria bacterium]|nr:hypothetical protein [Deltaproteobacteria bacterium]
MQTSVDNGSNDTDHTSIWKLAVRSENLRYGCIAIVFALLFGSGFSRCRDCVGDGDWDYFVAQSLAARRSVLEFGQLPLWNPFQCGGMPLAGNFQSRVFSPSFLGVLALGPIVGTRIMALLLLALGFEGSRRLARALGAGPWGALFVAFAFAGNGNLILHLSAGHLGLAAFALAPWLLIGVRIAATDLRRGICVGGLWGAFIFAESGLFPLLMLALLCGAWIGAWCVSTRSLRPAVGLLAIGAAIPLLCFASFLPATLFMVENTRASVPTETIPFTALYEVLFALQQTIDGRPRFAGQSHWWHEYGTYIGPIFCVLLVMGLWHGRRGAMGWFALGTFFVLLALGDFAPYSPWSLLHRLPVFASIRSSARAFLPAIFCFALAAAPGLERFRRVTPVMVGLFAINLGVVLIAVPHPVFHRSSNLSISDDVFTQRSDSRHRGSMRREHYTELSVDVAANRGNLVCYDPNSPQIFARPRFPSLPEAELVLSPTAARSAETTDWSPNAVEIKIPRLNEPALLVLNQNYASGWTVDDGRQLRPFHGLISTLATPDDESIRLVYRPTATYLAIVVNLLALMALVRYCWRPGVKAT